MAVFGAVSQLKLARIWEGVFARSVHADRLTIGFVDIDPGVQVPIHQHEAGIPSIIALVVVALGRETLTSTS